MAFLLNLQTVLSTSELVAIKWGDIKGDFLLVQRMEVKSEVLQLTNAAKKILNEARKNQLSSGIKSEFVFTDSTGNPIHKYDVDRRIRRYCNNIGIAVKKALSNQFNQLDNQRCITKA